MTGRLPHLPGAGVQVEDSSISPRQQLEFKYRPRDARKVQGLEPVFTLDDLRRSGALGPRGPVLSSLAYPGLTPHFLNEPLDGLSDEDNDDYLYDGANSEGSSAAGQGQGKRRGKGPPRSPSPDQTSRIDTQRYNATAAARSTLLHEKPSVVERMEKGVAACAVMRDNRHFRLFSLGVFQPTVNEVRTRSMHRVELHKHLSATTLRAPQADKEVRSAVQHDTVGNRLERMYHRVLRQGVDESGQPSTSPNGGAGYMGGAGGMFLSGGPAGRRGGGSGGALLPPTSQQLRPGGSPTTSRRALIAGAGEEGGRGGAAGAGGLSGESSGRRSPTQLGRHSSRSPVGNSPNGNNGSGSPNGTGAGGRLLVSMPSMTRHGSMASRGQSPPPQQQQGSPGSPSSGARERDGGQRTARSSDYWMRVTLPPEVIEAQLRHLAATTEANLKAYHDRVAAAQDALLQSNGLGVEALALPPEKVEQSLKIKLGQIQEDTSVNSYNYSSLSPEAILASQLGAASKQLLTATTLPQFIRAALDHVSEHAGELKQLKAAKKPDEGTLSTRRRARSKSAAGPGPAASGGDGGDTARTYGTDSARTSSSQLTQDGTEADRPSDASGSGIWPSYMGMQHRAVSAGGIGRAGPPAAGVTPHGAAGATAKLPPWSSDDQAHHLDHLRRTASPDPGLSGGGGAGGLRRWSPPPPVMAPGSRGIPTAALTAPPLGALPPPGPSAYHRRTEVFIEHKWIETFRDKLHVAEETFPESAPEGLLPLPPLPAGDMEAGAYVRSRLERLWSLLDMPAPMRLDLVLYFTGKDRALLFARHLELWEQAAVAVLGREAQVEALVAVQREIEDGGAAGLSLDQVSGLCLRVLRQTRWVDVLAERLQAECGWALSFHGKPYPGSEAITATHLIAFMEQLRQATGSTGLKP